MSNIGGYQTAAIREGTELINCELISVWMFSLPRTRTIIIILWLFLLHR